MKHRWSILSSAAYALFFSASAALAAGAGSSGAGLPNPATTSQPKLAQDGPPIIIKPNGGGTAVQRVASRGDALLSNRCKWESTGDAANDVVTLRAPMATRWWWASQGQGTAHFCVRMGLGAQQNVATPSSISLTGWSIKSAGTSSLVLLQSGVNKLGGVLAPNPSLWPGQGFNTAMSMPEVCTSQPVSMAVLQSARIQLDGAPAVAPGCQLPLSPQPWVDPSKVVHDQAAARNNLTDLRMPQPVASGSK